MLGTSSSKNAYTRLIMQWPGDLQWSLSVLKFLVRISWNVDQTSCRWPKVWLCEATSDPKLHTAVVINGDVYYFLLIIPICCAKNKSLPLSCNPAHWCFHQWQSHLRSAKQVTVNQSSYDERNLPFIWLSSTFQRLQDSFPFPDTPTEKEAWS